MNWLNNEELFSIYSTLEPDDDAFYYCISMNKTYTSFTFRKTPYDVVFASMDGARRTPPLRYAIQRLRKWEPYLEDLLFITAAHSIDVGAVLKPTEPIDPAEPLSNEYIFANIADARKATVPRNLADDADSTLIGEALDLSSKEKVPQPSRRLEEITESPTPLPAYYLLTHEGILAGWWTVWDKSLEAGTAYAGLTYTESTTTAPAAATPKAAPPAASPFGQMTSNQSSTFANAKPAPTFGAPSAPSGNTGFGKPAFGSPSAPTSGSSFGKPNTPGAAPASGPGGGATFGAPGLGTKPAFGTPAFGSKPAFGAASNIGNQSPAFGGPSQINSKPNPFMAAVKAASSNPFASSASATSPFASAASATSPFAAAGAGTKSGASSPFSNFATNKTGQSGFGNLGSKPGLSSFGSTVTVDSKASGPGSTLPSFANTPATQSGPPFGAATTSSFPSFTSTQSGSTDLGNRGRDEETPTPQHPNQLKQVTGVFDGKFKLGSTFKPDDSAKDDAPEPAPSSGGSMFGAGFNSALGGIGGSSKAPATPEKPSWSGSTMFPSTTPATAPRKPGGLFSNNKAESTTPKPAPPKEPVIPEEAPLPPDWKPTKPSRTDDEIPPLAGSPPVNVEAPSSSADDLSSSPLDDEEDGDLSQSNVDESEGEDGEEGEGEGEEEYTDEYDPSGEEEGSEQSEPTESGRTPQPQSTGPSNFFSAPTPLQTPGRPLPQGGVRPLHPPHTTSTPMFGGTRREPLNSSIHMAQPPTPQPTFPDLVDDEDERIREELDSEIVPSRTLAPFIARQEYAAPDSARTKSGHAAQIEIVYRDINSMIDTLGLNSRSLKAFIEWNERSDRYGQIDRAALEEATESDDSWFEKWALCEIQDLVRIQDELFTDLEEGSVKGVVQKLADSIRVISDAARLLSNVNSERRRISAAKDPQKLDALRRAALSKELADQQKTLRREYAQLLQQLCTAEDEVNVLRSKLVAHNAQKGRTSGVPTVDNIKRTITRLTDMIVARNTDILHKESRLAKALKSSAAAAAAAAPSSTPLPLRKSTTPLRSSTSRRPPPESHIEDTPFATPPTSRERMSLRELNQVAVTPEQKGTPRRGYGLFFEGEEGEETLAAVADRVDEGIEELRERAGRRRGMAGVLEGVVRGRGVRRVGVR